MYRALPIAINTYTYKGLKDLAYIPGNISPKTPEPAPTKRTTILTPPDKGNKNNSTSKSAGILTVALLAYQAQIHKAENDK